MHSTASPASVQINAQRITSRSPCKQTRRLVFLNVSRGPWSPRQKWASFSPNPSTKSATISRRKKKKIQLMISEYLQNWIIPRYKYQHLVIYRNFSMHLTCIGMFPEPFKMTENDSLLFQLDTCIVQQINFLVQIPTILLLINTQFKSNMKKSKLSKGFSQDKSEDSSSVPKVSNPEIHDLEKNKQTETSKQHNKMVQQSNDPKSSSDSGEKKIDEDMELFESLVSAIEKAIKNKVLPASIQALTKEMEKKNIWNKQIIQAGSSRLKKISEEVIDFQLDRFEVYGNQKVFHLDNVRQYKARTVKKNQQNQALINGIVENSVQIGCLVREHKIKTEILAKVQQKLGKRRLKVRPKKRFESLKSQFDRLGAFLDKNQQRCDLINQRLTLQIQEARKEENQ